MDADSPNDNMMLQRQNDEVEEEKEKEIKMRNYNEFTKWIISLNRKLCFLTPTPVFHRPSHSEVLYHVDSAIWLIFFFFLSFSMANVFDITSMCSNSVFFTDFFSRHTYKIPPLIQQKKLCRGFLLVFPLWLHLILFIVFIKIDRKIYSA